MIDVTLVNGKINLLIKILRYEKKNPDAEIKFHPHTDTASIF